MIRRRSRQQLASTPRYYRSETKTVRLIPVHAGTPEYVYGGADLALLLVAGGALWDGLVTNRDSVS